MKAWKRNCILAAAILGFGAARMPFESGLLRDLEKEGLSPQKMEISNKERLGQTFAAVAMGGLRTLVAAFYNLRAFGFFEEKKWDRVMDTYDVIVALAPRTGYYWETGSWHSAYNAASYYMNDSDMPPLRRKEAWRSSIFRGRAFLERGIRNNPDNWSMLASLGFMLSDANKFPAFPNPDKTFEDAAYAYRRAADTGHALDYVRRAQFCALARVKGKEKEALDMAHMLYAAPKNRTPSLIALLFVLEAYNDPSRDMTARALELYETPEKAYEGLSGHWQRSRERFPVYGVAPVLQALETRLNISAADSILNKPLPPQKGPDDWFTK